MADIKILEEKKGQKANMVSFEKAKDKDGNHKSFTGRNGTMYTFVVSFDNGEIGEANSTKEEPTWKLNTEYVYDITKKQIGETFFTNAITGMKLSTFNSSGGGNFGKSIEDWRSHAKQISISLACIMAKENPHAPHLLEDTINAFYNWIEKTVDGKTELYWRAFSVLESAINFSIAIQDMKDLLKTATTFFNMCNVEKETPKVETKQETAPANELPSFITEDEELPF